MIKINLNDKIYEFPEVWSEVILDKFIQITEIKTDDLDEIEKNLQILSVLTGIPFEEIDELPYTEYARLASICHFIFYDDKAPVKREFTIDNIDYVMIDDITKITTAEFVDMDSILANKETTISNLHIFLAILYRPKVNGKIEKYNSDSVAERAEIFRNKLTCDYVISATVFSSALGQACLEYIQDYLTI